MKLRGHNKFDAEIILSKKKFRFAPPGRKKQLTVETADFPIKYSTQPLWVSKLSSWSFKLISVHDESFQ